MTVTAPTLLSAQPFQGFVPAVNHGSISWSDDGQVMYVFTRGVKILVSADRILNLNLCVYIYSTSLPVRFESGSIYSCVPMPKSSRASSDDVDTLPRRIPTTTYLLRLS